MCYFLAVKKWFVYWRQRHPVWFILTSIFILALIYANVFIFLMRVYEHKSVSLWGGLYWTINRLTTTGELPPHLVYQAWPIQLLSLLTQISGLVFFFAAFPLVIIPAIEKRLRGVPTSVDFDLSGHIVICGYSPLVASLIEELTASDVRFVLVDNDYDVIKQLYRMGTLCLFGDPTEEAVLEEAQIEKAAFTIANREDEEENAKIVLTATSLSKGKVIALIDDISRAHYFKYAGAEQVLSPKKLLGAYLAKKATASWKYELFGENEVFNGYYLVELPVYPGSPIDGLRLKECRLPERTGTVLVGIWHRGQLELAPKADSRLSAENVLIALGSKQQLAEVQKLTLPVSIPRVTLKRHFIIAGYGDVGRAIVKELEEQKIPYEVIDPRQDKVGHYIQGDATDEATLKKAKINRAGSFIAASHIDRDNIFSVLLARELNPDLHILARANSKDSVDKLYRAGADYVFSLSAVAAQMLASMILGNRVTTLGEGLKIKAFTVPLKYQKKKLQDLRIASKTGCAVLAVFYDGKFLPNPSPEETIPAGATLLVLGSAKELENLRRLWQRVGP